MSLTIVQRQLVRRLGHQIFGTIEPNTPISGRQILLRDFGGDKSATYFGFVPDAPRKHDLRYREAREFEALKKDKQAKLAAKKAARKAAAGGGKKR